MAESLGVRLGVEFGARGAAREEPLARRPYARGSYSAFGVGSSPEDIKALARPVGGRVFLAGEHTDPNNPSTTHGAWRSGQRAAADVRRANAGGSS